MPDAWTICIVLLIWVAVSIPLSLVAGRLLARNSAAYPIPQLPRQRAGNGSGSRSVPRAPAECQPRPTRGRSARRLLTMGAGVLGISSVTFSAAAALGALPPAAQQAASTVLQAVSPFILPPGRKDRAPAGDWRQARDAHSTSPVAAPPVPPVSPVSPGTVSSASTPAATSRRSSPGSRFSPTSPSAPSRAAIPTGIWRQTSTAHDRAARPARKGANADLARTPSSRMPPQSATPLASPAAAGGSGTPAPTTARPTSPDPPTSPAPAMSGDASPSPSRQASASGEPAESASRPAPTRPATPDASPAPDADVSDQSGPGLESEGTPQSDRRPTTRRDAERSAPRSGQEHEDRR